MAELARKLVRTTAPLFYVVGLVAVAVFLAAGYAIFLDALVPSRRARRAGIDAGASA